MNPCPCCGHVAIPGRPGDYEICLVCGWEDDGAALRWPMHHDDGPNAQSLVQAQRTYRPRLRTRGLRARMPREPGWRRFDPELDWTHPALDGEWWPADRDTLYYWRPTYWAGVVAPAPPRDPTPADRLVERVRQADPEAEAVIADVEERTGTAGPMRCCGLLADVVSAAYSVGETGVGDRIVAALAPGLDPESDCYAPNCVAIGFLESEVWSDPALRAHLDGWPPPLREEVRRQLARRTAAASAMEDANAAWTALVAAATTMPVAAVETALRGLLPDHDGCRDRPEAVWGRAITARVLHDRHWLRHHPWSAIRLAWRHRRTQPMRRTLDSLRRPTLAG